MIFASFTLPIRRPNVPQMGPKWASGASRLSVLKLLLTSPGGPRPRRNQLFGARALFWGPGAHFASKMVPKWDQHDLTMLLTCKTNRQSRKQQRTADKYNKILVTFMLLFVLRIMTTKKKRRNNTHQDEARQDKTKRDKTRQDRTRLILTGGVFQIGLPYPHARPQERRGAKQHLAIFRFTNQWRIL